MAVGTAHPQEAVFQATTGQVVFKLALHVGGQRPVARGQLRQKRRVVRFEHQSEKGPFGSLTIMNGRALLSYCHRIEK